MDARPTIQNPELLQGQTLQGNEEYQPIEELNQEALQGQTLSVEEGDSELQGQTLSVEQGVVEERSLLARVGEAVRERMPRKLTAGLAAATIAVGGAVELGAKDTESANANQPTAALTAETYAKKGKKMTPKRIKNTIRNAMRRKRGGGSMIRNMPIKKALISKKGGYAEIADTPPYKDGPAIMQDYATQGKVRFRTWFETGEGKNGGAFLDTGGKKDPTTYKPTLDKITDRIIATSGKKERQFGDANRVVALKGKKATANFARTDTTKRSIKTLKLNKKGKVVKVKRYK